MMWGCSSAATRRASVRNRSLCSPEKARLGSSTLMATSRASIRSLARNTEAKPPCPSSRPTSNSPWTAVCRRWASSTGSMRFIGGEATVCGGKRRERQTGGTSGESVRDGGEECGQEKGGGPLPSSFPHPACSVALQAAPFAAPVRQTGTIRVGGVGPVHLDLPLGPVLECHRSIEYPGALVGVLGARGIPPAAVARIGNSLGQFVAADIR